MRVDSARNPPRFVTTPSICRFRMPAKYTSGSVNMRTALEGIPTSIKYAYYAIISQTREGRLVRVDLPQKLHNDGTPHAACSRSSDFHEERGNRIRPALYVPSVFSLKMHRRRPTRMIF